jgi:hypothetical protein
MKKSLFVLLSVIMLLSILTIPAFATQPDDSVEGVWCYALTKADYYKFPGGNIFQDLDDNGFWIGTFFGESVDDGRLIIHPSGYIIFKSSVTFESVEVNGKTGGLEMVVNGWIPVGAPYSESVGTWVITKSIGGLKGLHGLGTWHGVPEPASELGCGDAYPFGVPYEGSIHFENK